MTVLTVAVTATILTAGAAAPAIGAAAGASATSGVIVTAAAGTAGTAATVAGSAGAGAVIGSVTGAAVGGTAAASTVGAAVGAGAGAAVSSASAGGASLVTAGIASGPIGWLVLGASETQSEIVTYDCWKSVLHETCSEPSQGKQLGQVVLDSRIKQVIVAADDQNKQHLPRISLINIWDETFDIQYLTLPSNNQLVAHAVRIE